MAKVFQIWIDFLRPREDLIPICYSQIIVKKRDSFYYLALVVKVFNGLFGLERRWAVYRWFPVAKSRFFLSHEGTKENSYKKTLCLRVFVKVIVSVGCLSPILIIKPIPERTVFISPAFTKRFIKEGFKIGEPGTIPLFAFYSRFNNICDMIG